VNLGDWVAHRTWLEVDDRGHHLYGVP
jgi:hypothetical protein